MSSLIIKQLPLLELLTKVNVKSRKKILNNCDSNLIKAITECVFNVLRKNVQLTQKRIDKLKKYKGTLRKLANSKKNIKEKKKIIVQKGGNFLPLLLSPIVSYLLEKIITQQ